MKLSIVALAILLLIIGVSAPAQTPTPPPTAAPASNPPVQPDRTLEVRLTGTDLYDALVKGAAHQVEKAAEERDSKRWTWIGIGASVLIALVGFIGIRSYSDLRQKVASDVKDHFQNGQLLRAYVEESVIRHITEEIEKRMRIVSKELAFYRLSILASSIRAGSGFTNAERDAAMASLKELSGEQAITSRKDFEDVLEKIIESFASADLAHQLEEIDDSLSSLIERSSRMVLTLVSHYGIRVIGAAQVDDDDVKRFGRYADACKRLRVEELALPYMMVIEHKMQKPGWKERVEGLFQDAQYLKHQETLIVQDLLSRNGDASQVAKRPTGEIVRFCEAFRSFTAAFKDQVARLAEQGAAPDGGPAASVGNSGVAEGPPSVS